MLVGVEKLFFVMPSRLRKVFFGLDSDIVSFIHEISWVGGTEQSCPEYSCGANFGGRLGLIYGFNIPKIILKRICYLRMKKNGLSGFWMAISHYLYYLTLCTSFLIQMLLMFILL